MAWRSARWMVTGTTRSADEASIMTEGVVRPASGVAYVPDPRADELDASTARLFDAICEQFDPQGVLAA